MAFDTTAEVLARTPLLEIALTGQTLRYSDKNIALDDHTFYEGRILSFSKVSLSLGRIHSPEFRRPAIRVVLNNADGAITTLLYDNDNFAGYAITLKVGHGTAAADYTTVLIGRRRFPGAIQWNESTISISVEWDLQSDMRALPRQKFFPSEYSHMESKSKYLPIPWIYGDFRVTAGSGRRVPCYQIDATVGLGGRFKIAEELQDIAAVHRNGISVAFTASAADILIGEFVLDVSYDAETDTIEAFVLGATTATFAGAGTEFSLPRLAYDLLTNPKLLGIGAARMNVAAFAAWQDLLPANTEGRRWIGTRTAGSVLLAQVLIDGNADLYINASNEYVPVYRKTDAIAGLTTFRGADLKPRGPGGRAFSVEIDPERVYANVIFGDYDRKPSGIEEYSSSITEEAESRITTAGMRRTRRLQLNWLYTETGAEPRVQQELTAFSRETDVITLQLGPPGLLLKPSDYIHLAYDRYELSDLTGGVFQVREITYDYTNMEVEAVLWGYNNPLTWGTWTLDSAPNWATATAAQRSSQGFWTDGSGRADPADNASKGSKWF